MMGTIIMKFSMKLNCCIVLVVIYNKMWYMVVVNV
jgi:hypothetical protein